MGYILYCEFACLLNCIGDLLMRYFIRLKDGYIYRLYGKNIHWSKPQYREYCELKESQFKHYRKRLKEMNIEYKEEIDK